jgi:hypothetical protein
MRRAALWLLLALASAPALADEVAVAIKPLPAFSLVPLQATFGQAEWRGGFELESEDDRFGGFSSIAVAADGERFLAISDAGQWLSGKLLYDKQGLLAGVAGAAVDPILDERGRIVRAKFRNDAEAMGLWDQGKLDGAVIVGFESRTRAGFYDFGKDGVTARFQKLALPEEARQSPGNREIESIGRFPSGPHQGRFFAISEDVKNAKGDIKAWVFGGGAPIAFGIRQYGDYAITDAAFLPDGGMITIERSYGESRIPGMAIRRFRPETIAEGASVTPELLMEASAGIAAVDNMEGIAVHQQDGETRLTVISDDNFDHRFQRTLLLQFALKK